MGKVNMMTGQYREAINLAEQVIDVDRQYVNAILVKAESLYNCCQFEHSLLSFHQARVSSILQFEYKVTDVIINILYTEAH